MQTRYEFYKSLVEGDVITSVGCKTSRGSEVCLSYNRLHHEGWGKYARVTYVGTAELKPSAKTQIGIRLEGIDPSVRDTFMHIATKESNEVPEARKATKTERRTFIKEYVKTRTEIVEHGLKEIDDTRKRLKRQQKNLDSIAQAEKIDVDKLMKRSKKT